MKEELVSGLKNAIDRGSSLEQAMQTLLNAGYNPSEVSEAAQLVSTGATNILYASAPQQPPQQTSQQSPQSAPQQPSQQNVKDKPQSKGLALIIGVVITLVIFTGILLYLLYMLSKGAS